MSKYLIGIVFGILLTIILGFSISSPKEWVIDKTAKIEIQFIKSIDRNNLYRIIDFQTGKVVYTLSNSNASHDVAIAVVSLNQK
jgi:hypothetical protein